jgi:hypothetical protein
VESGQGAGFSALVIRAVVDGEEPHMPGAACGNAEAVWTAQSLWTESFGRGELSVAPVLGVGAAHDVTHGGEKLPADSAHRPGRENVEGLGHFIDLLNSLIDLFDKFHDSGDGQPSAISAR